jgi:hypothetical protein
LPSDLVHRNPSNAPRYDKLGFISRVQQCRDGDAACDFDGAVNASCTFHVRVCGNVSEIAGCYRPVTRTR